VHHSTCTYLFLVLFVFHHHQFMIFTIMIAGFNAAGGAPDETEEAKLTVLCTILLVLHMMVSQADKKEDFKVLHSRGQGEDKNLPVCLLLFFFIPNPFHFR